ncbi:polysaccharide deacetylase family sporulation protein PdaB [Sporolactobacillus spathodeae]|uniref:Polysaccharide deacetylase family sporulation protein PdaB n=2 Tax=Sporolactobacillus spathodeae TaxID=1465502 RepID=A0ABS2Q9Z9_9BACL|nr:polysaccharide deacetylase family sporulation protein PdaB [Sporolactobacillus spathodeae]
MLWIINGRRLKSILFIILAAFFAALILFVEQQDTSVFTPIKETGALSRIETDQKQLALTFDSNWGTQQINMILPELKKAHVPATFFFSGEWAERHPDVVQHALRDGNEIESHGMRHEDYTQMNAADVRRDMLLAQEAIYKASGARPQMVRPPYARVNESNLQTVSNLQLQMVLWSVNPQDDTNPGYKVIAARVLESAGKGDIIRLHASDSAKQTYRALPLIIREMQRRGYHFVTVKTLIADAKSRHHLFQ